MHLLSDTVQRHAHFITSHSLQWYLYTCMPLSLLVASVMRQRNAHHEEGIVISELPGTARKLTKSSETTEIALGNVR